MFAYLKRIRIINKALRNTVRKYRNQCKIGKSFWYGLPSFKPYVIGFWIFFKTDKDLELNSNNGKKDEIQSYLLKTMLEMGYPQIAFEENEITNNNVYTMINGEKVHTPQTYKNTTGVAFAFEETVKRDYDNNYYVFTK